MPSHMIGLRAYENFQAEVAVATKRTKTNLAGMRRQRGPGFANDFATFELHNWELQAYKTPKICLPKCEKKKTMSHLG